MRLTPLLPAAGLALAVALSRAPSPASPVAPDERCRPGTRVEPVAALDRALEAMGVRGAGDRILHIRAMESSAESNQSDRSYPPYFTGMRSRDMWIDPRTGVERYTTQTVRPGTGPTAPVAALLSSATSTFAVRDTLMRPVPPNHPFARQTRLLNPWLVVLDWRGDSTVRYAQECTYRDYPRVVLERDAIEGKERLYLDPKSGYPVKVDYEEPHYLWGQIRVEYLYSTWIAPTGGGSFPGAAFRLEDGEMVVSRTSGLSALEPRDSTPSLAVPAGAPDMRQRPSASFRFPAPDTVRVGPQTYLLVNPAYTETVTMLRDTVYLLDATLGEDRARQDSAWIARLFPRARHVAVVVTDLAWPHIAGVRFWAARGATFITHEASRDFLQKVTARRWTLAPDALERSTAQRGTRLRMRTVSDSLSLAGGRLRIYPIDGISSEGALMAYLPDDRYLWASDFVQTVKEPSQYGLEVRRAAYRVGAVPERFAAEHMPLTPWADLEKVVGGETARPR